MSSTFVSPPPAPATPPAEPPPDLVGNDAFFPDVSIATTREILLVPTSVTNARVIDAITGAMLAVNRQLASWRAAVTAATLAEVAPEQLLGTEPRLVAIYHRAIRATVAAELVDLEGELMATEVGRDRAASRASPADDHRRLAVHCVRDLLGKPRTRVRLV